MNYLPNFNENSCISLDYLESNYIRVYDSTPDGVSNTNYTDYFFKSNYISRSGTGIFTNVNCSDHSNFTTDFYYRYDFPFILLIFSVFVFFIILVPIKIWSKLFKRGSL